MRISYAEYSKALTEEFTAACDQISAFVEQRLDIGMVREQVLRDVLSRHLPEGLGIARGYVVSPLGTTPQVDVLIYDRSYPVLYKRGDLVVCSHAACRAMIEVKTRTDSQEKRDALLGTLRDCAKVACAPQATRIDPIPARHRPLVGALIVTGNLSPNGAQQLRHFVRSANRSMVPDLLCFAEDSIGFSWWTPPNDPLSTTGPDRFLMIRAPDQAFGQFVAQLAVRLQVEELFLAAKLWTGEIQSMNVLWHEPI